MSDRKCAKKVMGGKPISEATPQQLRKIEKCSILAAGGKPNPKVFGKEKKGYVQPKKSGTAKKVAEKKIAGLQGLAGLETGLGKQFNEKKK